MKIRRALPGDIPFLMDFQKKMAKETENVTLNEHLLTEGISQLFKNPEKGIYYVAELDTAIAGCLMTTFEWSEWRNGNVLWIQSVYVSKAFRGRGVYKEMYSHIKEIVQNDSSLKGIRLYADKNNKGAHHVYSKMGMNGDHYLVYEWMK
jgi:ribosomal protein S18 acetylase RimI-like enzyme